MPYIKLSTNASIAPEKKEAIKSQLGKLIEIIPRKTEKWLMCDFEDNAQLFFSGTSEDAAYMEVKLFGTLEKDVADRFSQAVTALVSDKLSIPADRIYISYFTTLIWGWNGRNF